MVDCFFLLETLWLCDHSLLIILLPLCLPFSQFPFQNIGFSHFYMWVPSAPRFFHGLFHLHHVSSSHLYHNSQINMARPYVSSEIKTLTINPSTYLKSPLMCPKCTQYSSCTKLNVMYYTHHMRSSPFVSLITIP